MNQEHRDSLVRLEIEKADRFFAQAEEMCRQQYWDIAANRYYYACYHAVQGLFIHDGISSHTHRGLNQRFGLNYIKTGKIPRELGSFLAAMEQLREKGDYNCKIEVSETEVRAMHSPAEALIAAVKNFL